MKRTLTFILLFLAFKTIDAQKINLIQYSSFCESDILVDSKYIIERIENIQKFDYFWRVEMTVIDDCSLNLYPTVHLLNDTLFIKTNVIETRLNILEKGDTIYEMSIPEECYCAYNVKMDLSIDTIANVIVNDKNLPITNERFQTFPIRYFTFKNDTTGIDDKYGLRQGQVVYEKDEYLIKQLYKDNELISCELYDSNGVLLKSALDCEEIYELVENNNNNW